MKISLLQENKEITNIRRYKVNIEKVETYPLIYPLNAPYGDANGYKKYRSIFLIRMVTKSGIEGWGECSDWLPSLAVGFKERIIPYLQGKSALDRTKHIQTIAKWHKRASAAVSMALIEIAAKSAGLHICDLWGGRLREQLPVYASLQSYRPMDNWQQLSIDHIKQALDNGFTMAKIKIGGRTITEDQQHIKSIQREVGHSLSLILDANQSYDTAATKEWNGLFERWDNLLWLEEPLPFHLADEYAFLRSTLSVPLAGGENVQTAGEYLPLLQSRALDIIQPDPMHHAGIDAYRETLAVARQFGSRVSPHCFDGSISRAYAIFAQACLPPWSKMAPDAIEPVEWDIMDNPFTRIFPLYPTNGYVKLPQGTGTGLEVDIDFIRAYAWDGGSYTQ
jgi:D-galactarolactone cycloisomerase